MTTRRHTLLAGAMALPPPPRRLGAGAHEEGRRPQGLRADQSVEPRSDDRRLRARTIPSSIRCSTRWSTSNARRSKARAGAGRNRGSSPTQDAGPEHPRQASLFHDGTPFDAEAVKFNLERSRSDQRSSIKADLGSVQAVEVSGPAAGHAEAEPAGHRAAADPVGPRRHDGSPKAVKELGKDHDRKPVGTGP